MGARSTVSMLTALSRERPSVWQYPPAGEPRLGASILSSPAIGNDERHSVYVGASDNNVYAFYDGIRIKGKVSLVEGSGDHHSEKTLKRSKNDAEKRNPAIRKRDPD